MVIDLDAFDEQRAEVLRCSGLVIGIDRFYRQMWERGEQLHSFGNSFVVLSRLRIRGVRQKNRNDGAQTYDTKPASRGEFRLLIESRPPLNT